MSYFSRRSSRSSRSTGSRYDDNSYYGFAPYVPVAVRRAKAQREAQKAAKAGKKFSPVVIEGRKIARTFWGEAWCKHLESYSDFENRLPRGRTYVRNGSVIDLQITRGRIAAQVMGSEIYQISVDIKPLAPARWAAIKERCVGGIGSLMDLLRGRFSDGVMSVITDRDTGLFPAPAEIKKDCSCPDWADLCKHLAAVLYGVGARLDKQPELLFVLRGVDHLELIEAAARDAGKVAGSAPSDAADGGSSTTLAAGQLADVFGIEIDTGATPAPAAPVIAPPASSAAKKTKARGKKAKSKNPVAKPPKKTTKKKTAASVKKT